MKVIVVECPSCGAILPPRNAENRVTCEYCDQEFQLEDSKSIRDEEGLELDAKELLDQLREEINKLWGDPDMEAPPTTLKGVVVIALIVAGILGAGVLFIQNTESSRQRERLGISTETTWPLKQGWSNFGDLAGPFEAEGDTYFVAIMRKLTPSPETGYLVAFSIEDMDIVWKQKIPSPGSGWYLDTQIFNISGNPYLATSNAQLQQLDPATGKSLKTHSLSDVATHICLDKNQWVVAQKDEESHRLNLDSTELTPTERPQDCPARRNPWLGRNIDADLAPEWEGLKTHRVHTDSSGLAIAIGEKNPGTRVAMLTAFRPPNPEPIWSRPTAELEKNQIKHIGGDAAQVDLLYKDTLFATVKLQTDDWVLLAREAQTGTLLWKSGVPTGSIIISAPNGLSGFEERVVVQRSGDLLSYDIHTGALIGYVGSHR